jgi:hypothetical protein
MPRTTKKQNPEQSPVAPESSHDTDDNVAGGALAEFARAAEAVAATTKKLEKAALLGAYFHTLDDADLVRAARYFAGHQFAMNDAARPTSARTFCATCSRT